MACNTLLCKCQPGLIASGLLEEKTEVFNHFNIYWFDTHIKKIISKAFYVACYIRAQTSNIFFSNLDARFLKFVDGFS